MKWIFYVVVFIYMFYRAVYGAKTKDLGAISVETVKYDIDKNYLIPGVRKSISCIATNKNQKLEWVNPEGDTVQRFSGNRVFVQENLISIPKSRTRVPALVLVFTKVAVEDTGVWACQSGDIKQNTSLCVIEPSSFREGPPLTVDIGRSITLSCHVKGDPEPRIQWSRDGNLITDTSEKYLMMMKYNSMDSEGLLTITSLNAEDSGTYTCEAIQESPYIDDCSHVETMNITLQVNYPPVFDDANDTQIVYAREGQSAELTCSAKGFPIPSYRWLRDNEETSYEFGEDKIKLSNDGTEAVLALAPNTYDWNQRYSCRAKNQYGEANQTFLIKKTVKPTQPSLVRPIKDYDNIQFNLIWYEEMTFPVDSVDVQYFKAKSFKGRKPKESDWMRSKLESLNVDSVDNEGVYVNLNGLDETTEYYVRLRAVNSEGKSHWTKPLLAITGEKPEIPEEPDSDGDEDATASPETEEMSNSTFYGIFFAGGVMIIAAAAMFLIRMV